MRNACHKPQEAGSATTLPFFEFLGKHGVQDNKRPEDAPPMHREQEKQMDCFVANPVRFTGSKTYMIGDVPSPFSSPALRENQSRPFHMWSFTQTWTVQQSGGRK